MKTQIYIYFFFGVQIAILNKLISLSSKSGVIEQKLWFCLSGVLLVYANYCTRECTNRKCTNHQTFGKASHHHTVV